MHIRDLVTLGMLIVLLVGCGPRNPPLDQDVEANVQKNLHLVAEGTNQELTFKADRAGVIRVYDFQKGDYLYTGPMKAGEQFRLIPDSDHAMINKQPVYLDHATNRFDEYRLYFMSQ